MLLTRGGFIMNDKLIGLIGVKELAKFLSIPPSWIYSKTRVKGQNTIPCLRVGKYLRFNLDAVMEWLQEQSK